METVEMAREKWDYAKERLYRIERKLKKFPLYIKLRETEIDKKRGLLRNDECMFRDAEKRRGEVLEKLQETPLYIAYEEALREAKKAACNLYMARKSA